MRIVAVFNLSGGVGKTTLTQNQSYHMAKRGYRTLVVDLDPQGWATHFMADEPEDFNRTIKDLLLSESDVLTLSDIPLVKDLYGVDLIPANLSLRIAESSLPSMAFKEYRLRRCLEPLLDLYDFVFIDCPPSMILSELALSTATDVLVPIGTNFKPVKGTDLLFATVARIRKWGNPGLKICGFVPFLYDARRNMDNDSLEWIEKNLPQVAPVFGKIRTAADIPEAASARKPLEVYSPKHPVIEVFESIADMLEPKNSDLKLAENL